MNSIRIIKKISKLLGNLNQVQVIVILIKIILSVIMVEIKISHQLIQIKVIRSDEQYLLTEILKIIDLTEILLPKNIILNNQRILVKIFF